MAGVTHKSALTTGQKVADEAPLPGSDVPLAALEQYTGARYLELIAAVIRSGLEKEGPAYLLTPGGQYWCRLGNLDLEAIQKQANQCTREGGDYPTRRMR